MRPPLGLLATVALLAVPFAGCLGEDAPAAEGAAAQSLGAQPVGAMNGTVDDGPGEMAADLGHQPHIHDYWKGRERVTLMDEEIEVSVFDGFAFTFYNTVRGTPGVGGAFVEMPDGAIVYEGTGQLEFTASWTDATVTGMGLSHRSPADPQFGDAQPLSQGKALVIPVAPEMCDMPHEKDSRWAFLLLPGQAGQAMVGKVHVKIDIVRMRDIGEFPGHPELFGGAHTLTLFSGAATSRSENYATQSVGFLTGGEPEESGVASQKVVPMETRTMTANVTIKSTASSLGEVSDVRLLYKPADSAQRYSMAQELLADAEAGIYQFAWPVKMRQTDSPYAETSQWRFDLYIATDPTGQGMQTRGFADAQVDYELEVVAYDSLLEGVESADEDDD